MKNSTWKAFRKDHTLRGLWLDMAEPDPAAAELRLRGRILSEEWGRTCLALEVRFSHAKAGNRWKRLKPRNRHLLFDLTQSRGGVQILANNSFYWASLDGRSCSTAPNMRGLQKSIPQRPSKIAACKIFTKLLQH